MKTLRGRLWFGFGGLLSILVVVSVLSVVVLTRYSHTLERVFRENYDSAVYCDAMKDALDQLDLSAQRRLWGAVGTDAIDASVQRRRFAENLRRQSNNVTLDGEKERTDLLAARWTQFETSLDRFDAALPAERPDLYRRDLLPRYQQLKQDAQALADMNMANMVSVDGQAKRALIGVRNTLVVLVSLGTLFAAVLVGAVAATLFRPLQALTESARAIGGGNLDGRVDVRSDDEVGQLAESFNEMARQLREFRRLDHEKLARAKQTTQLAIDSLPDAVFLIDPNGVVEIANRAAHSHFGIEPGVKVEALKLDWLTRLLDSVRREREPWDPQSYSSALQVFDQGRERFLLPRAVPVPGVDQQSIGITVILVDVTRLRHADELKSGLLSTVSHELRTPLTSIRMALSLLSGGRLGPTTAPQKKLLTAATSDSDRLYRIIENLLNMSRIEAGTAGFQPQDVPVGELIESVAAPMRAAFEDKGLVLRVARVDPTLAARADPASVGYVLANLLGNALKLTPAGGEVVVSAAASEDDDGHVRLSVADTGPGVPAEFAARIFDKFFRLPREKGTPGAGLGLAIARQIAEAHGGTIRVRPRAGGGSEFVFTLPAASPAANVRELVSAVTG